MENLIYAVMAFFVGAFLVFGGVHHSQEISPSDLVRLLKEQCDEEKIERLRSYECQTQLTPVLTYKDGSIKDITWKKEQKVEE